MNYELALELKNVGFPQPPKDDDYMGSYSCGCDEVEVGNDTKLVLDCENERVYKPTLSELIEACGEDFRDLMKLEGGWPARTEGIDGISLGQEAFGATPEEAVAKLWLALNKK